MVLKTSNFTNVYKDILQTIIDFHALTLTS